jgi:hypothetical protein
MLKKNETLKLLDLNGNKFGEDGKLEILDILKPMETALGTLSEDEGSDEEDQEVDEDEQESEEEEEEEDEEEEDNSEVLIDEEYDDEDYDQVEDENEDYENGDYNDEGEKNDSKLHQKFGNINIAQEQSPRIFKLNAPQFNPSQTAQPNLFSNLVKNSQLMTSISAIDAFILNPNHNTLKGIDEQSLNNLIEVSLNIENSNFLFHYLSNNR